jgi:RimJ/RimL family protein N-acetyltransferase
MGEVTLRTARLLLRPARPSDLADFHAMMSDDRVMRFWSREADRSLDETAASLDRMIAGNDKGHDFVLELEGRAVGKAGAYALPEVGFLLRRDLWGRGLVAERWRPSSPTSSPQATCRN